MAEHESRVAWVTGGGRGIGREIVAGLARREMTVLLGARARRRRTAQQGYTSDAGPVPW
ncbi:MAG: hypothetical protein L0I76_04490 [Pseudonocardia sp.]|nr:hypothetical protein [Pseudonocardia sp.]